MYIATYQGRSQGQDSNLIRSLLSTDTHSLPGKTLGYKTVCNIQYTYMCLFTMYCKTKMISQLHVHCSLLDATLMFAVIPANCCNYSKIMYLDACAQLANNLSPVAKKLYSFDTLHEGCRGIFLADHQHMTVRFGLPCFKSSINLIVCYSKDFTVSV